MARLGVFVGDWLRGARPPTTIVRGLVVAGVVATAVGLLWGQAFPINKPLWTSSYVVFTSGMAALCLAACYWLVDMKGYLGLCSRELLVRSRHVACSDGTNNSREQSPIRCRTSAWAHVPAGDPAHPAMTTTAPARAWPGRDAGLTMRR